MTAPTPGQAAYEAVRVLYADVLFTDDAASWSELDDAEREAFDTIAQAAIKASDVADDFLFERKQVVALRAVLGEIFTCLDAGDPALLDGEQVDEWRERSGIEQP